MIDFDKAERVSRIWFAGWPGSDFHAITYREGGVWKARYRWRYHASNQPFDDRDEVRSFQIDTVDTTPDNIDDVIEGGFALVTGDAEMVDRIHVDGSGREAFAAMIGRPWAHVRVQGEAAKA